MGLHSRGVISAISVGNTSALPAGSPSGGVTVGAAAKITETDVQAGGGRGGGCFSPLDRRSLSFPPAGKYRPRRGEEKKMVNEHKGTRWKIPHGHKIIKSPAA